MQKQQHPQYNRLVKEKSPYLLQHKENPVDWYPWGEEAFARAAQEEKPIFLSIGYSTCHWCHVMERESFEDEEVAALLNREFVAIKVDREERPDIDTVYMNVCQAATGQGGWPLTVLMTPERQPFFVGTYFPKKRRYGKPGLMEILQETAQYWKEHREKLEQHGLELSQLARRPYTRAGEVEVTRDVLKKAVALFTWTFDREYGGFGSAPKFPAPHQLIFLLRYAEIEHDTEALHMAEKTLQQMYRGGLFDHVGYGFSRYSTDEKWLVPHFEKMLYDNALLIMAYAQAFRQTGKTFYRDVAEKTIQFVLRDMRDPAGGFYTALDADSDGEEGKYYTFTKEEILQVLGQEDGRCWNDWFDVRENGNFEGKTVLNLLDNAFFMEHNARIGELAEKLRAYRERRAQLACDDKVLTGWNALMIAALAQAYQVWGSKKHLEAAQQAERFLSEHLTDAQGRLQIRWRDGEVKGQGNLDDYAYLLWALLELYGATFDAHYLERAVELEKQVMELFGDESGGGFYYYSSQAEPLIHRPKELYDGALPSGNSVMAFALIRLSKLTGNVTLEEQAQRQLQFVAANIEDYPPGHCFFLIALMYGLYPSREIVCTSPDGQVDPRLRWAAVRPHTAVLLKTPENEAILHRAAPFTRAYAVREDKPQYYICENHTCSAPRDTLQ